LGRNKRVKIAFIGSNGHINYALKGFEALPELEASGVAPGSPGAGEKPDKVMQALSRLGQSPGLWEDPVAMLEQTKPDVAVIAGYMGDNAALAIQAMQRGVHVFIEKPAATTEEELEQMREVYSRSGVQLAAMLGLRYDRAFYAVYLAVRAGAVGTVRTVHAQKSYKLGRRSAPYLERGTYGGTIPWVGSHAIDWIHWISGERFKTVYALHSALYNRSHGELELSSAAMFTMTGEVAATANIDFLRPDQAATHGDDRIRVAGTSGVLEVRAGKAVLLNEGGETELELQSPGHIFVDFIRQIQGTGACLVSADDSFYTTEAVLLARRSADDNTLVPFPSHKI
jgi:predicted dehydrogenase